MATHRFQPTRYYSAIGSHEPALRVQDGDTVITATLDARGWDWHGERLATGSNPMTGPFWVEGAEPGDTLAVTIDRLTPTRDTGWTSSVLAPNVVEPDAVRELPEARTTSWTIDRAAGVVALADPPRGCGGSRSR